MVVNSRCFSSSQYLSIAGVLAAIAGVLAAIAGVLAAANGCPGTGLVWSTVSQ